MKQFTLEQLEQELNKWLHINGYKSWQSDKENNVKEFIWWLENNTPSQNTRTFFISTEGFSKEQAVKNIQELMKDFKEEINFE